MMMSIGDARGKSPVDSGRSLMGACRGWSVSAGACSRVRHGIARGGFLTALVVVVLAALLAVVAPAKAEDTTPPQVTSFTLGPTNINTESADQTVYVSMNVTDAQSGVGRVDMSLLSPGAAQQVWFMMHRVWSDASSAYYTGTATMAKGSIGGVWRPFLDMTDGVGNSRCLQASDLDQLFGAGCAEVTNAATTWDAGPPQVTAFSITPLQVNTESADQTLTVTATLTDDQSGVSNALFRLCASIGTQSADTWLERVSGDDLSGVYTGTVTMPKGSQGGVWRAGIGTMKDNLGNTGAVDLVAQFGAASAEVTNAAATWDAGPPQVTAFSITPTEFNTESAGQTLAVTATLTDDQSGVGAASIDLRPLIGNQWRACSLQRVSGDDLSGVYSGTLDMPKGTKEGMWSASLVMTDNLGDYVWLGPDELASLLPNAEGLIIANTAAAQQVTIEREWTLSSKRSSITFPSGTVVTRQDGGSFAFYKMTAQPFTLDDSIPTTDLDGVPVATLRFGIPGLDLAFDKPVTVSMTVESAYNGYRLNIQSLTEGGAAWANETTCNVVDGRVFFTVNHATRFAASLAVGRITQLSPSSARRGAIVTIVGKGFGKTRGSSTVKFGAKACASYVSWSAKRIRCRVPATARFGLLKVTVKMKGGTSNATRFRVKR
jgi:hypothetical protein